MSELHEQAKRLNDVASKLLFEVERLRKDVRVLSSRLKRSDTELPPADATPFPPPPPVRSFVRIFADVQEARRSIVALERDLSAIRGRMDAIEADAQSREDMKRYIINPPTGSWER